VFELQMGPKGANQRSRDAPEFGWLPLGANGVFSLEFWTPMAYIAPVARRFITVAETPLFIRQAQDVWDDAEREGFIEFIARNPEEGDLIPETGGVRKIRWTRPGGGKRGGARVIYFYHNGDRPLYLLMIYVKARQENLTTAEKKIVRKLAAILKN
jgi:hypothetical protein